MDNAAIRAMLAAQTAEDLERTILDAVPGAIGFQRAALLAPASADGPAEVMHSLGDPPLDLSEMRRDSPLAAGAAVDGILTGDEDDDRAPHANVRGTYLIAPLREHGRTVRLFYADTLRAGVPPSDAAADFATALEIAGMVRANFARTDPLTGLPNRRVMEERLEDELHRSARSRRAFAFAILDLDQAHTAAEEALQRFASALRAHARHNDFSGRIAGGQFALILIDVDSTTAAAIIERMLQAIRGVQLTASAGVTLSYPVDSAESLLERAEAALYQAKQAGRDQAVFG